MRMDPDWSTAEKFLHTLERFEWSPGIEIIGQQKIDAWVIKHGGTVSWLFQMRPGGREYGWGWHPSKERVEAVFGGAEAAIYHGVDSMLAREAAMRLSGEALPESFYIPGRNVKIRRIE